MISNKFQIKYFIFLTVGFLLFTAIGTLTHEVGHYTVSSRLGYKSSINYRSSNYNNPLYEENKAFFYANRDAIVCDSSTKEKELFKKNQKKIKKHRILIILGGPLETLLTGCLGLFALYYRKRFTSNLNFKIADWFFVFLALFWLREVFNLVMTIGRELFTPNGNYFGYNGDEVKLSYLFGLPAGTIPITLGVIGFLISLFVVFKVVPIKYRLTFILSGFFGGISGFYLWMKVVGPILLP